MHEDESHNHSEHHDLQDENGRLSETDQDSEAAPIEHGATLNENQQQLFCCEQCDKVFTLKANLDKHMKVHSGEKLYQCDICQKKFSQKCNLDKHKNIHTGERPFKCEYCDKSFIQNCNLKKHVMTHLGEKPFKCEYCPRAFIQKGNLQKHVLLHFGNKPFHCGVCANGFTQKINLQKHMEKCGNTEDNSYRHAVNEGSELERHIKKRKIRCTKLGHDKTSTLIKQPTQGLQSHDKQGPHQKCNDHQVDYLDNTNMCVIASEIDTSEASSKDYALNEETKPDRQIKGDPIHEENDMCEEREKRVAQNSKTYKCIRCDEIFSQMEDLEKHVLVHSSGTRSDQILFDGSVGDDFWSLQEDNMLDASQIIASFPTFLLSEDDQTSSDVTVSPDEKSPSQNHMLIYKTEPFESD